MDNDEFQRMFSEAQEGAKQEQAHGNNGNGHQHWSAESRLAVMPARPIRVSTTIADPVDGAVVSYRHYNCFNYASLLSDDHKAIRLSLGITSPNAGEGKTTAVSNLAAALSLGTGRKTVVVDFHLSRPRIHKVFGTMQGPGLLESLLGDDICVIPTQISNLFVLPVGNTKTVTPGNLPVFREVLSSLFREFDFVIVDLPPTGSDAFPTLIANQLNGLLVVVKAAFTRRRDLGKMFRKVREESVLGFVMTNVRENDL